MRLAVVQAEPVWNNLEGCIAKTCSLIKEAGQNGANILGFPETWIPGYPRCLWRASIRQSKDELLEYRRNSMARDSPEMEKIKKAAKEAGIFVVLGYCERDRGTLYCSNAFIAPSGELVHHRRKIKPTSVERVLWGEGQAESVQVVTDSQWGRIGALNCWEHYQPLLRYAEYSQGVDVHVACWPGLSNDDAGPASGYHTGGDANLQLCRVMAMEGAIFVMVATQFFGGSFVEVPAADEESHEKGFSMIYGPDGSELCKALPAGQEGILYADVDLKDRDEAHSIIDVVGHYSRPDLLSLNINTQPATHVYYK